MTSAQLSHLEVRKLVNVWRETKTSQTCHCGERSRNIIFQFFVLQSEDITFEDLGFQQNRPLATFPGHDILRYDNRNWPPRSVNFTATNILLWGFLRSQVHTNKPTTTHTLKAATERNTNEIPRDSCKNVIENLAKKVPMCRNIYSVCCQFPNVYIINQYLFQYFAVENLVLFKIHI